MTVISYNKRERRLSQGSAGGIKQWADQVADENPKR